MTIKVLEKAEGCFPQEFEIGDWSDLCTAEEIELKAPQANKMHIRRSSTFKKYGLLLVNSQGIIDNSYKGDNDQWMFPAVATRKITIPKGTRIAQFRVQLSQKATVWQKLKWLFSSKPKLVKVDSLGNPDRKGIGEGTGI